jgi:hypothetical protein
LRGWQLNETNTGLAGAGVDRNLLPVYTGPSTPPAGTVIRMMKITTPLFLYKGNITLDRVWVQPKSSSGTGGVIFTYDPNIGANASTPTPVTIMDSDIDGTMVTDPSIYADCAVRGSANLYRNRMFGMGSGICVFNAPGMPNVTIERNYVHGLRSGILPGGGGQSHNESATIRSFSGSSLVFKDNRLISRSGSDSGALFIQAYAGSINNVLIEGNIFDTAGYGIPLEAQNSGYGTNMRTRNNRFVKGGYGPGYVSGGPGWAEWNSNYFYDSTQVDTKGAPVPKP